VGGDGWWREEGGGRREEGGGRREGEGRTSFDCLPPKTRRDLFPLERGGREDGEKRLAPLLRKEVAGRRITRRDGREGRGGRGRTKQRKADIRE
jgi:hypothetical protein